jgi:hypothetical protein
MIALRVKKYCSEKLQKYKVPMKVSVVNNKQYSERFKKKRGQEDCRQEN